jgi:hypothetical protein
VWVLGSGLGPETGRGKETARVMVPDLEQATDSAMVTAAEEEGAVATTQ